MTITSREYEGRTIFFCTEEGEWTDLTSKGHVVYRADETLLLEQQAQVLDETFRGFLFRAKLLLPRTRVYAVR